MLRRGKTEDFPNVSAFFKIANEFCSCATRFCTESCIFAKKRTCPPSAAGAPGWDARECDLPANPLNEKLCGADPEFVRG